jgi:hypothetical protein
MRVIDYVGQILNHRLMLDRYCRCILFLMCFTLFWGGPEGLWSGPGPPAPPPPPLLRPCPWQSLSNDYHDDLMITYLGNS